MAVVATHDIEGFEAEWIAMPDSPEDYQKALFKTLRTLNDADYDLVLIEPVPDGPEWAAVRNRLEKVT